MSETFLVTGAGRGIGLALTKVLLSQGDRVFAACRNPQRATELTGLKKDHASNLEILALDVDSDASAENAAKEFAKKAQSLDVLMNVAGISPPPFDAGLEKLDFEKCRQAFETNCIGPLRVARAFLPFLRRSKNARVLNMTSGLASLSGKNAPGFYAYGTSKAALNMLTRTLAFEFQKEGLVFVVMDPGWVRTDMGGPNAMLAPEESAMAIAKTVKGLTLKQTSLFLYNDGKEIAW
jgi:NAD(P)-dependent dehydrogenase (short-subunit alcohol dehydrogenase family)